MQVIVQDDKDSEFMIKLVFGERIKFLSLRPETTEELRLACGKAFGMIANEVVIKKGVREVVDNPEEEGGEQREPDERDRNVMAAMNFNYIDPQGDKIQVNLNSELHNLYKFASIAK